ncbi:MAG: aldose epimerase [bacterium]
MVSPDGNTRASFVPELGGIGSSLILPGPGGPRELIYHHDFMWDRDPDSQRGGWPFLFPICGRLERDGRPEVYVHGGREYRMKIHGFSLRLPWHVVLAAADELTMALADTDETRAVYPFRFEVRLRYRVENGAMVCEQTCVNRGDSPMPYYAGFHPYFRTPPPGGGKDRTLVYCQAARRLSYNGKLSDVVGESPAPAIPVSVADPHVNEMLFELGASGESRMDFPDGLSIHMDAGRELFPYLQFYTKPDRAFFCIEPWMGVPNSLNHGCARVLAPGARERATLRVWTSQV